MLTQTITLEAGDEEFIEVKLVEGGGLDLVFSGGEGGALDGFRFETRRPGTNSWSMLSTYVPTDDGGFLTGATDIPNVSYKSWEPLPVGELSVRLSAEGFRTVEEMLPIRAAQLTKWSPHMEKLPENLPR